jgi:hypothetical protein
LLEFEREFYTVVKYPSKWHDFKDAKLLPCQIAKGPEIPTIKDTFLLHQKTPMTDFRSNVTSIQTKFVLLKVIRK